MWCRCAGRRLQSRKWRKFEGSMFSTQLFACQMEEFTFGNIVLDKPGRCLREGEGVCAGAAWDSTMTVMTLRYDWVSYHVWCYPPKFIDMLDQPSYIDLRLAGTNEEVSMQGPFQVRATPRWPVRRKRPRCALPTCTPPESPHRSPWQCGRRIP